MALKYRALGRTGVMISELGFGAMNFADGTDDTEAERIVARYQEEGGNFLDTANAYSLGKSEEMLGRVLKKLGNRDWFIVATKANRRIGPGPNNYGNSRLHIIRQCEESLKRLQVDHIDLFQIHRPDPKTPIDETLSALDDLVKSGKIRYIGCSSFPAWSIVESLWASSEQRLVRFISDQPPFNLLDRRIERDLIPMAQAYGLAVITFGPLGGGMLTGKYRRDSNAPEGARYTNDRYRGEPIDESVWRALEALEPLATAKGISMSQFALAWVLSRPGITVPIIGPRLLEQLEGNFKALDVVITEEESAAIDKIVEPGSFVKDYYVLSGATARW